jgi:hypothetical protein
MAATIHIGQKKRVVVVEILLGEKQREKIFTSTSRKRMAMLLLTEAHLVTGVNLG